MSIKADNYTETKVTIGEETQKIAQFGANARLELGGLFLTTRAESLAFEDGTVFSALEPENPLLTVSVPCSIYCRNRI
ncbi:hypothetical protein [Myxosarcina sp. GI1(2024)]